MSTVNVELKGSYEENNLFLANQKIVKHYLSTADLWGQLAEECAELAQAALKMQRICTGNNKPAKTEEECIKSVIEEHADVNLVFKMLEWNDKSERYEIMRQKANRWANRLLADHEGLLT